MAEYKLTYFNLRGIAEPIRLMLVYRDVPYENVELEARNWETIKKDIKWGQVPFLEHKGKTLTQSKAIINYIAERHDLTAKDAWKKAKCEEVIGAADDLRVALRPMVMLQFEGKPVDEFKEGVLPKVDMFLTNLEGILQEFHESEDKTDFILGDEKPTAADFVLAQYLYQWTILLGDPYLLDKYALLKKQQKAVFSLPRVDKYIEARPNYFI